MGFSLKGVGDINGVSGSLDDLLRDKSEKAPYKVEPLQAPTTDSEEEDEDEYAQ
jgi:hypothetical protein